MSERSRASRRAEEQRHELNRRLRATFVEGAEERSREKLGRGLTDEEPRRIMRRYPGDLPDGGHAPGSEERHRDGPA